MKTAGLFHSTVHESSGIQVVDLSDGVHVRLACIANAVHLTVLLTQQAAVLYDIGSPHSELETSRRGKTAVQWTYHVQEV